MRGKYSHYSLPMTLNEQLPRTMVWTSQPVQQNNTSVYLVWRESVNQLSTTPLNSFMQGKSWERPCREIRHVKNVWIVLALTSKVGQNQFQMEEKGIGNLIFYAQSTMPVPPGRNTLQTTVQKYQTQLQEAQHQNKYKEVHWQSAKKHATPTHSDSNRKKK